jgi:hypothetical protein
MELLGSLPCSVEHITWVRWIYFTSLHSVSLRLILILFSHPHHVSQIFWQCFYTFSNSAVHATCPGYLIILELFPYQIIWGQIIGSCSAGAPVIKTATLLDVSRATVSKVILAYTNHGKTSPYWNSGWESKSTERDHCTLRKTVLKNDRNTAAQWQQNWIFIFEDHFHKAYLKWASQIHGRAVIAKPVDYWR